MDPLSTCLLFEQFLAQRRYLKNVTPSTGTSCDSATESSAAMVRV
jgi:hypothetical protein